MNGMSSYGNKSYKSYNASKQRKAWQFAVFFSALTSNKVFRTGKEKS